MDDEDGRCLLDVICDPEALNDFLHGSETHLDTDDLLDGSSDPSSSFFSAAGGHVSEVQPTVQLSANEPPGLPRVSVDLDFLEDDDILGGSPGGESGSNGIGTNHEPCDILQQSLAEANITEQSLQEAEAELDLGSFGIPGLTQVVQTLPDASLTGAGGTVGVGIGVGGAGTIFTGGPSSTATPPNAAADMLGSVLAQQGLQLQPQVMNKAISVQPFMQPVGLGNVTLQPISSLHTLPNGSQPGLGIGQIQVVGQPTVMTINQSGQPILAKAMGGYQLHQSGPEISGAGSQAGLGSSGSGLLIQGNKATLGSPALNGPTVCVSSTNSSSSGSTVTAPAGIVGFGNSPLASGIAPQPQTQGQIMQNVIIQRTPTPIQPKPPQGGAIQPKLYKQQQPQPTPQPHQNDGHKGLGLQQIPVSAAQNVAFLAGKPGSNVVLSTQATSQASQFSQTLFKPQAAQASGKPLSVHLLNQSGSIVIPSQTVLQGQNPQFVQLQAGGQILTQHPGGHIITSQGPGGQLIANQILTTNQNINLGQVLTSQGPSGAAHILSGPIQLQPGQMGTPTLFQMPVSLAQTHNQAQTHTVTGHAQTVIQGMPIQNPLMLGQVEGLSPAVSLQTNVQPQTGGVPSSGNSSSIAAGTTAQGQPECVTVLGSSTEQTSHPTQIHVPQPSVVAMQPTPSASSATPIPSSSPSISVSTSSTMTTMGLVPPQTQQNPGRLVFTNQGSSMILSQESLQMFLQQELQHQKEKESTPSVGVPASVIVSSNHITAPDLTVHDSQLTESWVSQSPSLLTTVVKQVPSSGHQQPLKIQNMSPAVPTHPTAQRVSESPQPSQSPLTLSQHIQSPHQQSRPPSQPQPQNQTPSRSCTPSHPPLFIIHNQSAESPQPTSQPQTAIQVQLQPQPTTVPGPHQQEMPLSQSPKPPSAQHQFSASPINTGTSAVVKAQVPVMGLSTEQQHHLQLVTAQIQTLSAIAQPSPQQKQLLEKLHQVHHNIMLQSKQPSLPQIQPQATTHFGSQQDVPLDKVMSSSSAGLPSQIPSVLQPTSVVVKTPATGASDLQVFSGAQGPAATIMNQTVTPTCLNQPAQVQPKPGVISSVGGLTLGKGGVQIQVLGTSLTQMPAPQPPAAAVQTHTTMKMPFTAEPSKEARLLEQLRKQQGSALHPNYSAPFNTFEDTLHRLLPYHLYQGNVHSSEDYEKVDEEFERVSSMLQKRTQAMVDKYRHLLFSESKQRLGPSAEMVMIDRMFIQEEKVAISQDRILAKERPEEFLANVRKWESAAISSKKSSPSPEATSGTQEAAVSLTSVPASAPTPNVTPKPPTPPAPVPLAAPPSAPAPLVSASAPIPPISVPAPAPVPTTRAAAPPPVSVSSASPFPPTKLVIKQGGSGASVSWSSSCPTPPIDSTKSTPEHTVTLSSSISRASAASSSHFSSPSPFNSKASDDDDTLLQRTSKPPIKTYEARRRIGLKLKIKQDQAGFSKVVHNTALDPVHTPQPQHSSQSTQPSSNKSNSALQDAKGPPSTSVTTVIRTQTPVCTSTPSTYLPSVSTAQSNPEFRSNPLYKQAPSTLSKPSVQMNGTMEHHSAGGTKPNPTASSTSSQTTCRLPLRKTYRENVSPRVRPGIPGGGDEGYPRTTDSPSCHKSSSPSERTVIASVKVEKRDNREHVYRESSNDVGRLESAMHGLDHVDEVFSRGLKTSQHNVPQLSDRDCSKEKQGEHTDFETGESKYKKMKNRQRAGGTFRMDQHAPGPPSPESFTRDSLLPAKRCKSDSPDMDNASFSSGSPPDDSLNEHLQCAIDSILNLQQEPTGHGPHIKSRPHHDHHLQGVSTPLSHRPSVLPSASSSSLAQHPQVRGRGHNGSLVPQTQSR
ncbi:BRD4-interacting chromatin-remodeling complex-associated protein isoform X1 [Periophthalmus magnuspinnatus]|uniref:BRD4-interacting chromatin-remodeling complex-associated protein isoform X1 n=1 Tax=Periophthalmus magnuspinnatus TaxID=409849 RepID=UPI00145ADDAD|nr:BRD4-interacting chromatin-remodeling complex-associated protein isoform X1 [Periophthalmus magnuspinnatus]XP_055081822.1 BRD4-interacting chromatin-remodeling complex-associated protein isoform X1 [Periophthalmus magnuspinnatus]